MAPVLRFADFAQAASYYSPPPAPVFNRAARYQSRPLERIDYSLDATELPLIGDYSSWVVRGTQKEGEKHSDSMGYECEIAGCHAHLLALQPCVAPGGSDETSGTKPDLTRSIPLALTVRPLPAGGIAVFSSAEAAESFVSQSALPDDRTRVQLAWPDGAIAVYTVHQLSERQRPRPRPAGSRPAGPPRALAAALAGVKRNPGGPQPARGARR